jgi:rhomboid-like protein
MRTDSLFHRPIRTLERPVVVGQIVKLNIMIFFLWIIGAFMGSTFMMENFLVSWTHLVEGKVWTLVTSAFSHNMFFHIFINMYVFYGFGAVLENHLGSKRFLIFYLVAGVVASLSHCLVSTYLLGQPDLPALGASGAVAGVILLFSLIYPYERILVLGLIPVPAIWGAVVIVGLDVWGLVSQSKGESSLPIGHGAHLGGALTGLLYFLVKRTN